jgi:hypothetical protein
MLELREEMVGLSTIATFITIHWFGMVKQRVLCVRLTSVWWLTRASSPECPFGS